MRGHISTISLVALVVTCLGFGDRLKADHGREIRPKAWQQDATINDVFFVNNTHGWAVGDQGVILRTTNGGDEWLASEGAGLDLDGHRTFEQKLARMRPLSQAHELYPLTCSLNSVFFINERRGWIAGNYEIPYLNTSRSVLLTTNDGGKTWAQLKGSILPRINRIYFQSVLAGWSLGNSGHLFDSGVFTTSGAGSSWSVTDVDPANNWIDGELVPGGFVVIDDRGILGRIDAGKFEPAVVFGNRPGQLRSVRMLNSQIGWAVGTAGTILMTADGGQTWKRPEGLDPQMSQFDFHSVSIGKKRVWIAGDPGTFVFSFDARKGDEFKQSQTGNSLPVSRIYFSSDRRGWVCGANGMMLRTDDYGKTWQQQRGVGQRVALMVVTDDPQQLPLAALSYISNEQNQLAAVVLVGDHDPAEVYKAAAASSRVGVSTFVQLQCDDLENEQSALDPDQRLEELVRAIRTLQPNVLTFASPNQASAEFELACRSAIEMAADHETYPAQLQIHLQPWQVDRFMVLQDGGQDIRFEGSRYLTRSGKLLEDQIAISRAMLGLPASMKQPESYRVESFTGSVSVQRNDIFFGLEQLGNVIPKRQDTARMGNLNSIATAPLKNKEIAKLVAIVTGKSDAKPQPEQVQSLEQRQMAVRDFATGSEARESGIWLMQVADELIQIGELEMAAYAMEQLLVRNSSHAFAPAALMWLTQYYASDEIAAAIIAQGKQEKQDSGDQLEAEQEPDSLLALESSFDTPEESEESSLKSALEWRIQKASGFLLRLKRADLDFAQSSELKFAEAMLSVKVPGNVTQENTLNRIRRTDDLDSKFIFAASREIKTRKPNFEALSCLRTESRPRLDGGLDDQVWKHVEQLGRAIERSTDEVQDRCMLAYDDEFLYLAVRCQRLPQADYAATSQIRTRDSDLSGKDRIQLKLDTDRDLRSAFVFEIDYRGWASESCFGATGWNPDWYIASGGDSDSWTLECAIPLESISVASLQGKTAAISLRRLDNHNRDIWPREIAQPAAVLTGLVTGFPIQPKNFELLRFETGDAIEQTATAFSKTVK